MPPAGLEPAALCLASSIRLSLTARQSWGCWLDYILDVSVPTRIVSEDPFRQNRRKGFLRITQSSRVFTSQLDRTDQRGEVPEALRASPHTGSSTQWVPRARARNRFPIKAPTRQMLYPLSYRGINVNGCECYHVTRGFSKRVLCVLFPLCVALRSSASLRLHVLRFFYRRVAEIEELRREGWHTKTLLDSFVLLL